jgi:hypothetical protein
MADLENGLPASPEAERSILGSILLAPELIKSDAGSISTEDFYLDSHRRIFNRMLDLADEGSPIDVFTVSDILGSHKELESVGGMAYVSSLTDGVPRRTSIKHYCNLLRSKTALRKLVHLGQQITSRALEQDESPEEIITHAQKQCLDYSMAIGESESDIFVDVSEFCAGPDEQPDWLIEGLIERGSNGIVAADPKGAKSLTVAGNMSVCLALGVSWLGLSVKRCRVALVSREDNPSTTKRRIKQIVRGKGARIDELQGWLHINSKAQSKSLMLDNPREVTNLIRCLKKWRSEFVIMDVFNKLHVQDENDNTKVRGVMNQIDRIQAETGAQICVLHHWNKGDASQSLTRRIRGAGSIAGFAEWIAGIEMEDEANQVRKISFETKVGSYLKPICYQIIDNPSSGSIDFRLMEGM